MTSGVVLSVVWLYLYDPAFGLLNFLIGQIGIEPVLWLADPRFSLLSLVIMYHASHWGGSIILLTASMGSIPKELYEAASIEGRVDLSPSDFHHRAAVEASPHLCLDPRHHCLAADLHRDLCDDARRAKLCDDQLGLFYL